MGREIALAFAEASAKITVCDQLGNTDDVMNEIESIGGLVWLRVPTSARRMTSTA